MTRLSPPAEFLAEEIEARGWAAAELAHRAGLQPEVVEGLLAGSGAWTEIVAAAIGAVLGTGSGYWLNLDRAYRESKKAK